MTGKMQGTPKKKSTTATRHTHTAATNGTGSPTHDAIAARAYELYEKSGFRNGSDAEFWLEAERQLRRESISAKRSPQDAAPLASERLS
jgi:hypothetical protein